MNSSFSIRTFSVSLEQEAEGREEAEASRADLLAALAAVAELARADRRLIGRKAAEGGVGDGEPGCHGALQPADRLARLVGAPVGDKSVGGKRQEG